MKISIIGLSLIYCILNSFVFSQSEDPEMFFVRLSDQKEVVSKQNILIESEPGSPRLSAKTFYIAIPFGHKLKLGLTEKNEIVTPNYNVEVNPSISMSSDSVLVYSQKELDEKYFKTEVYPKDEIEITGYTWIENYYCAVVRINSQRYNWKTKEMYEIQSANIQTNLTVPSDAIGKAKKLNLDDNYIKSIILNYDTAIESNKSQAANPVNDTTGNWINYSREYLKIAVSKDGLYRLTSADLEKAGVSTSSINPQTFQMFFKGKVIPIYVLGESDLKFDATDYIEFWGKRNYGSNDYRLIVKQREDYKNYLDRYTDTSFVWLTWNGENGNRIVVSKISTSVPDSINSSLAQLHLEQDLRLWYYDPVDPRVQMPQWQENKVWTWLVLGNSGSQSINFQVKNILPNSNVTSYVRLISNASDITTKAHKNGVSINSITFQDTLSYDYRQTVNISTKYPSSILKEGTNVFRVFGMPTKASFHQSLVDWVDIDYFRKNIAENDSILITLPDSIQTKLYALKVSNIIESSGNIIIYKIKPTVKKFEDFYVNSAKSEIVFIDTVRGGDQYIISKIAYVKKPNVKGKSSFKNFRNNTNSAEYIILTHKSLLQSASEYQKFISQNYGITTKLIDVSDIYDEFSFGMNCPESIREFLKSANANWQSPKPGYLLLIGDANYDYKDIFTPAPSIRKKNLVPSFGTPVSDVWYTIWDDKNIPAQQMFVGRIPAISNEQVMDYLKKHKDYLERPFDEWNKSYLFLSGGDPSKPSEMNQIKTVNDNIFQNLVSTRPVGGIGKHFYKTSNPISNMGPYTADEISNAIDKGALIISYLGHSGTQTWDNGITKVDDIKNKYADRFPLISDFGCSTGKFAEPDVDAFGELFITGSTNGKAIVYLGNSSFGYLSTSTTYPVLFYDELLHNPQLPVGKVHWLAKLKLIQSAGINEVNRAFIYCNLLFGDPIIKIKIPPKPNYSVDANSCSIITANPNDSMDSVAVKIVVKNLGSVPEVFIDIKIEDELNSKMNYSITKSIKAPLFQDQILVNFPVKKLPGLHKIRVTLDPLNKLDELFKNDNSVNYEFSVFSSSIKSLDVDNNYSTGKEAINVLNPTQKINPQQLAIQMLLSEYKTLNNSILIERPIDIIKTKIQLNNLIANKRYYWKSRISNSAEWSESFSFINSKIPFKWYFDNSVNNNDIALSGVTFDSTTNSYRLNKQLRKLTLISAGSNEGKFASLKINTEEALPNSFFWGIATALIDTLSLTASDFKYFVYPSSTSGTQLKNYIDTLKIGTVLALAICDDAAQSVLGAFDSPQRKAIESLGSRFINSVGYRESWCLIGKKGAPKGSVPEVYKKLFEGQASIELSKNVVPASGYVLFPRISNSINWKNGKISLKFPTDTKFSLIPLGVKNDGKIDTLKSIDLIDSTFSLTNINAAKYGSIQFLATFYSNKLMQSPEIKSIAVNFITPPELVTNYQVVTLSKDSLDQGETTNLNFSVYNVGESTASNFKVRVDLVKKDNPKERLFEQVVDSIQTEKKKDFSFTYTTDKLTGSNQFQITIDPDNSVTELYKDNNFYSVPFFVKPNNKPAALRLTIDGSDIINGDFISSKPNFKIELSDESLIPITDTTKILLYLNNKRIYFASNNNILNYNYSSSNPKMVVNYTPTLSDGDYTFKVVGKNATDQIIDSTGIVRKFTVKNELQLLNAYNYPNPFKDDTYFTFKLTQIPDELRIIIYTIAGRKIKEIKLSAAELKYDFNRIFWDGRDQDGDLAANGVYLYKIISQKGSEKTEVTEKLAIIR